MSEKMISTRIDPDLHHKFKIACAVKGVTVQDAVAEMIEGWLAEAETETEFWVLKEHLAATGGNGHFDSEGEFYDVDNARAQLAKSLDKHRGHEISLVKVIKTDVDHRPF